jgi:hypothetical protein
MERLVVNIIPFVVVRERVRPEPNVYYQNTHTQERAAYVRLKEQMNECEKRRQLIDLCCPAAKHSFFLSLSLAFCFPIKFISCLLWL